MMGFSLCASLCCPGEDFPPVELVTNNTIITIENNRRTFNIGESISIETSIDATQTTISGNTINLNNFIIGDSDNDATYAIVLYRENEFGETLVYTLTDDNLIIEEGDAIAEGRLIQVSNIASGNQFRSRFSITLQEPGTYNLAGVGLLAASNSGIITVNIGNNPDFGFVNINSRIVGSDERGSYTFTVN